MVKDNRIVKGHFNSYKEGIDLNFLQDYCLVYGKVLRFKRGEELEHAGKPARWFAYVTKGSFKYMVHNQVQDKDYITGFAFQNEFVADYPNCMYGRESEVSIVAGTTCEIYAINGEELCRLYDENPENLKTGMLVAEAIFTQTYTNALDHYRLDACGRYKRLIDRNPQILQHVSLKDIASYLNITPQMLSRIRRRMTFTE